jgi:multiple antibiotic resistance protein
MSLWFVIIVVIHLILAFGILFSDVLVAGSVGVGLFIFGAILQAVLHFSTGALNIISGLILLLLAPNMVLGSRAAAQSGAEIDPISLATSPLAIPLTLNPVGIVALVVASSEVTDLPSSIAIVVIIGIIMAIDLGVLLFSDRVAKYLSKGHYPIIGGSLGNHVGRSGHPAHVKRSG